MTKLTASEASKLINVSRQTIHRWRKSNELGYVEKTDRGFLYDPSEVLRVASIKNIFPIDVTKVTELRDNKIEKVTTSNTKNEKKIQQEDRNEMLQNLVETLQNELLQSKEEYEKLKLKNSSSATEITLLREQLDDVKKDKERIFNLMEKNSLLIEHIQTENITLKAQEKIKKRSWWFRR